ncbi:accessory factor UbiK family protein [Elioraea sp.]|uniref:accessory factor UbiK family protein n=1 Tax=Elioraea sp. TaxID=2185103 RepID=UPI0025BC2728|nr:accessory factor UbiK family protein [Elioraea sp.]
MRESVMKGGMGDDFAGVAGGAFAALAGLRREVEQLVRSASDDVAGRLELARREEVEVLRELVLKARAETDALAARVAALEAKLAAPGPAAAGPEAAGQAADEGTQ